MPGVRKGLCVKEPSKLCEDMLWKLFGLCGLRGFLVAVIPWFFLSSLRSSFLANDTSSGCLIPKMKQKTSF